MQHVQIDGSETNYLEPSLNLWFLVAGYLVMAAFLIIQELLRRTAEAKTFQRGAAEKGSMLLIGVTLGVGLWLPLIVDVLGFALFPIDVLEGLVEIRNPEREKRLSSGLLGEIAQHFVAFGFDMRNVGRDGVDGDVGLLRHFERLISRITALVVFSVA